MSLDVYLYNATPTTRNGSGIFLRQNGTTKELSISEAKELYPDANIEELEITSYQVYSGNITHNLNKMADAAGIYKELWRPDEIGITEAHELIWPLREGLHRLKMSPDTYRAFDPENGWGDYEGLVSFVSNYLDACYQYPEAKVSVSR